MSMRRVLARLFVTLCSTALVLGAVDLGLWLTAPRAFYVWPPGLSVWFHPNPQTMPGVSGTSHFQVNSRGMRGDVDGYVAEFNPVSPTGPTVYTKWFTGWDGSPGGKPKPIWRLVGNGRITLDTKKRLPMYQNLDKQLIQQLPEVPLISVSKFFVVNKRLKNMYVAFTDFNPALRTAYIVQS